MDFGLGDLFGFAVAAVGAILYALGLRG